MVDTELVPVVAPSVGALGAFAVAAITVPIEGRVVNALVLLALAAIVLTTRAVAGRQGAVLGAVMAAFAFDFFHVAPVRVLHARTLGGALVLLLVLALVRRSPAACTSG
jgi:K+-sensing histidine kinase KdpD